MRRPAPLTPPPAQVPGYQHVFLFYFENEDYHQIVGNTKQAPYMNSLLKQGSVLSQFYAEEHPSDGNYLAVAGGSTFGIPLDDPEEENPLYTIRAGDIGDLIDAAHETWKTYLQSANGPCDDTVHGYYWNDDQPMMYFTWPAPPRRRTSPGSHQTTAPTWRAAGSPRGTRSSPRSSA